MKTLLLALAAVVVTLLLGEAGLRVVDKARPPELPPPPSRPEMFMADPAVGYRLWPSTRTCMRYPPGAHRVTHVISNSDGFPSSRELGEPDPRPRVLVLGDSFTFGVGVDEGHRFTEVVEELEPRWRVDNVAMVGWGLDLMVRALERYGPKAQPNVVVLAVYTDDFRRVHPHYAGLGYGFTKFALRDGRLVDVPYPRSSVWSRLRLLEVVRRWRSGRDRDASFLELNRALVARFQELTAGLGATPVILFLPGRSDTAVDQERRAHLARWAAAGRIAFHDFTDVLHGAGVEETYLPGNWHWSEHGHRLAGEALHARLAGVVPPTGARADHRAAPRPPWRERRWSYCHDARSTVSAPR
jgi:hypothetical protein